MRLALLLSLLLVACTPTVTRLPGLVVESEADCTRQYGAAGWWAPGYICTEESVGPVTLHELCHEMAYKRGLSRSENEKLCHR